MQKTKSVGESKRIGLLLLLRAKGESDQQNVQLYDLEKLCDLGDDSDRRPCN